MKYKVGDRVRIKSLDWYNENKNEYGNVKCHLYEFSATMRQYCGTIRTIRRVDNFDKMYKMEEDGCFFDWTDEMIEGCVESIEDRMKELRKMCTISLTDSNYSDKVEVLLNDYEYIEEEGKSYFVKKKKEYPKTYEECCKVLNIAVRDLDILDNMLDTTEIIYSKNLDRLLNSFRKLIICRDAYWKIAGEEMGLGKPWEPSDSDYITGRYCIFVHQGNIICSTPAEDCPLTFPTEEIRDAFYENFKDLIESCKELL